jgi:3-oxoacyl-[acyl-carrier protein] reductase
MPLGLESKRILLTGGTRGIGRATALELARAGARLVVCYRQDEQAAKELAAELAGVGDGHHVVQADVAEEAGVERLIELCRTELGGLDVLINNVGVDAMGEFSSVDPAEWKRVLDANLTSMFLVTRAALALLGEGASIVNISSALAYRGGPFRSHYSASKAGVLGLTRSLCKELGPRGIRVNVVAPGVVEKEPGAGLPPEIHRRFVGMTALGRLARPEEVAGAVLFLASDLSSAVTGVTLPVDGGV